MPARAVLSRAVYAKAGDDMGDMGWYMVLDQGKLTFTSADPMGPVDIVQVVLDADRVEMVPLPGDLDEHLIAYADADGGKRWPNVFFENLANPIRGPLIILGRDGENHRWVTDEELGLLTLEGEKRAGLPVLRKRVKESATSDED